MNDEETDTLRLLMWIEKLEQKISKLEREVIDIKNMNRRLVALETATRQLSERSGKPVK
ncbi:MAG: hypothetical protein V1854_01385 [Methanobacteriota archaeon]